MYMHVIYSYLNFAVKMKKPQDSDIFGTKSLHTAPRITNDLKVNPNAQFQARMDAQYDQYSKRVNPHYR